MTSKKNYAAFNLLYEKSSNAYIVEDRKTGLFHTNIYLPDGTYKYRGLSLVSLIKVLADHRRQSEELLEVV